MENDIIFLEYVECKAYLESRISNCVSYVCMRVKFKVFPLNQQCYSKVKVNSYSRLRKIKITEQF